MLRDLDGKHVDLVDQAVEQRRWWLSQWEDGAPFILCLLAQDVQESVHELDPMWPLCSEHQEAEHQDHCLLVEPDLGTDPFWVCPPVGAADCGGRLAAEARASCYPPACALRAARMGAPSLTSDAGGAFTATLVPKS